jgi:hypothetical protein
VLVARAQHPQHDVVLAVATKLFQDPIAKLFGVQVRQVVQEVGQPLDAVLERGAAAFDKPIGVVTRRARGGVASGGARDEAPADVE